MVKLKTGILFFYIYFLHFYSINVSAQTVSDLVSFAAARYYSSEYSHDEGGSSTVKLAFSQLENLVSKRVSGKINLGFSKNGLPVEAYYFPGRTNKHAMVIGGMHGSELSSIQIAKRLITQLDEEELIDYHVLIIPSLFPDNASKAMSVQGTANCTNIGRYSNNIQADPNRQMPLPGKSFKATFPYDAKGRIIEMENQWLLQTIQFFEPSRIINIHAIRDIGKAGIFADPRTNEEGIALGFEPDSLLAINMAAFIERRGGCVPGNALMYKPTAIYHNDFPAAAPGYAQQRNLEGSKLPGMRGAGISLGTWASTAVKDGNYSRNAIQLLTMEFPGYNIPKNYKTKETAVWCNEEIEKYAAAISKIFLVNNYANN